MPVYQYAELSDTVKNRLTLTPAYVYIIYLYMSIHYFKYFWIQYLLMFTSNIPVPIRID